MHFRKKKLDLQFPFFFFWILETHEINIFIYNITTRGALLSELEAIIVYLI